MDNSKYILTGEDAFKIGLAINRIAMLSEDKAYEKIKSSLTEIEETIVHAKDDEVKICERCGKPHQKNRLVVSSCCDECAKRMEEKKEERVEFYAYKQGRTDAIDECISMIKKCCPREDIAFGGLLIGGLEQLKEQKNE